MTEDIADPAPPPETAAPETPPPPTSWREGIADPALRSKAEKYSSPADLTKAYAELESRLGKSVVLPGETADEAALGEFYTKLGRPEKPEDYKIGFPEGYEATDADKKFAADIAPAFHKAGLTPKQVEVIVSQWNEIAGGSAKAASEATAARRTEAEAALKKEWGNDYDTNLRHAKAAITAFGGDPLVAALEETGLGDHPAFAKAFAAIGRKLGEDSHLAANLTGDKIKDAKERLDEIFKLSITDIDKFHSPEITNERLKLLEIDAAVKKASAAA